MKRLLVLIVFYSVCFSANAQLWPVGMITFDPTDTLYPHLIVVDTVNYHHNIWQIGRPHKTVFDSAYSYPNAIVTDTVNPYPPNDTSVFILKIPGNTHGSWVGNIGFYYQLDIDSGSMGRIDVSLDNGISWQNITSFSGYYFPGTDTPSLRISTTGWTFYNVNYFFERVDSISFHFTFISDSILTAKNGWIIDNIGIYYYNEGVPIIQNNNIVKLYPNPTNTYLTVISPNKISQITIDNLVGQIVLSQNYNTEQVQIDVSNMPEGVYLVKINGSEVRKFVKE